MAVVFTIKDHYTTQDLQSLMQLLRSPEGCPWDREQTHQSIRSNLLEETHEAIEAINQQDDAALCEELGDVLLQIVFHAQMADERQSFSFDDVVDGICKKLVVRHPHVFGDVTADTDTQVLKNWDKIKRETKGGKSQADLLRAVPQSLPALMRSAKVQGRAARVGFDWKEVCGALEALCSETQELRQAIREGDPGCIEEELGDVLFSAVNVSRFVHCDAEQALTVSCDKFIRRFEVVETLANRQGIDMTKATIAELDELWATAKTQSDPNYSGGSDDL